MPHRRWPILIGWCVAFAAASWVDVPVARWVRASGTAAHVAHSAWAGWVKVPGAFWFTAAVVGLLWAARRIDWRRTVFVFAVAALAGLNVVVKWVVGRTRPFKLPIPLSEQPRPLYLRPFWHGLPGLFNQHDLSFPSGHACTASALAIGVLVVYPPAGWPLVLLAVAVGVERVLENAHYASDVVAAYGLAAAGGWAAWAVLWPWVARPRSTTGFEVLPRSEPGGSAAGSAPVDRS